MENKRNKLDIQSECLEFFKGGELKDFIWPRYDVEVNYDGGPEDKVFRVLRMRRCGNGIEVEYTWLGQRTFVLPMYCLTLASCENILEFLNSQPKLS